MRKIALGILAHVDAGKTSLSEAMLYTSGKIRHLGRVDNQNAYLDTHALERQRGITIFSKQAIFPINDLEITLMDTPGHVDFSAETERTLPVLDCAILVISGSDGIQGHTKTLWQLLTRYEIPTFIFVNKMDQHGADAAPIMHMLKQEFSDACIAMEGPLSSDIYEQLALCDEHAMDAYLGKGQLDTGEIQALVARRKAFPVYFGSALKQFGVESLMNGLSDYAPVPEYTEAFGATIYKISRDPQGTRLTHLKITGGELKVKDSFTTPAGDEKINQIRLYSGERFDTVSTLGPGSVCAVTGLSATRPGDTLGVAVLSSPPLLEPVLSYALILPEETEARVLLPLLKQLEEEEPTLRVQWSEANKDIHLQLMGEVQTEILQALIRDRFGVSVTFGDGAIVYKETIEEPCEGVGHFEPLRHYAEVHLLLEPGPRGSGLQFRTACSEDLLDKNWQRLVLSHLQEKTHRGVLTGAPITDMSITLVSGRAHSKHTAGGDFREATYRAVRQGLKSGKTTLLEPYYGFRMELPSGLVGKAMTAIDQMNGVYEITETHAEQTVLSGRAPVSAMQNYHREVLAYTKGHGRLTTTLIGYDHCHNSDAVILQTDYDSERDSDNPTGSVFCQHGSGFYVPWDQVKNHMHLESIMKPVPGEDQNAPANVRSTQSDPWISLEEIDQIINSTYYSNQGKKNHWRDKKASKDSYYENQTASMPRPPRPAGDEYLLIDGYNIIFAWADLAVIAEESLESARMRLMDILCNYQGIQGGHIIVVFDAYRVEGRRETTETYHNISLVFTAEAQTADQYIEKFARDQRGKIQITVATSDGLQQLIIRGAGCRLLSARELKEKVDSALEQMESNHLAAPQAPGAKLRELLSEEEKAQLMPADPS